MEPTDGCMEDVWHIRVGLEPRPRLELGTLKVKQKGE